MRRALEFPVGTVTHLVEGAGEAGELADLAALERAGLRLGLLALPSAVEDSFYRYNNLPLRLAELYRGVDPADPDEDLLEEAEAPAQALIDQAFLLDEVIDAIYQALRTLPPDLLLRRPGERDGERAGNGRGVLLALKRLFRGDWLVDSVMRRLLRGSSIGLEARPVLVHAVRAASSAGRQGERLDSDVATQAERTLGRAVSVVVDPAGDVLGVHRANGVRAGGEDG